MTKRTITFKDIRVMLRLYITPWSRLTLSIVLVLGIHIIRKTRRLKSSSRRFRGDLQKMINNMEGKSYEERLYCLKLWTLEERRNRQRLIEVFKMCNGLLRLKLNEFFYSSR